MGQYFTGSEKALDSVMSGENTILLGPAGSGKSVFINTLMQFFQYDTILCATSGIAARSVGGATMHSTFKLPVGFDINLPKIDKKKRDVLASPNLSRIIVDEAFMARADGVDHMNTRLQQVRGNDKPFGGLQMVFVGDPLQLGSILQKNTQESVEFYKKYQGINMFDSHIWRDFDFNLAELHQIYRQGDAEFSRTLSNIREGIDTRNSVAYINQHHSRTKSKESLILATTRKIVSDCNITEFKKLKGTAKTYTTKKRGKTKDLQVEDSVTLKDGCRVMITSNCPSMTYVNGTLGTVKQMNKDCVVVSVDKGDDVLVNFATVPCYEYQENKNGEIQRVQAGEVVYMPLMLAYAATIHRLQGTTLDTFSIDLGWGAFCAGQAYTALSRATTLKGMHLKKPLKEKDIIVDHNALNWLNSMRS